MSEQLIAEWRPGLERALQLIAYERGKPLVPAADAILAELERGIRYELEHGPLTTPLLDT